MNAEEIINDIRKAVDCYYEDGDADILIDKLENTMMFYHEELHPQGCGKSILADIKTPDIKDVHVTQEQIEEVLNKTIKPDELYKDFIDFMVTGFPSSVKFQEEFKQELIKTIKDGTSKP